MLNTLLTLSNVSEMSGNNMEVTTEKAKKAKRHYSQTLDSDNPYFCHVRVRLHCICRMKY